jgi:hypothetical protein
MQTRIRRGVMPVAVFLALAAGGLAATPASAQAGALAQYGCGADICSVVPAAWDSPYTYSAFADAVNFTNYANVTGYIGYTNVVNAVNYTNLANYVAYRNAANYLTWSAGR